METARRKKEEILWGGGYKGKVRFPPEVLEGFLPCKQAWLSGWHHRTRPQCFLVELGPGVGKFKIVGEINIGLLLDRGKEVSRKKGEAMGVLWKVKRKQCGGGNKMPPESSYRFLLISLTQSEISPYSPLLEDYPKGGSRNSCGYLDSTLFILVQKSLVHSFVTETTDDSAVNLLHSSIICVDFFWYDLQECLFI